MGLLMRIATVLAAASEHKLPAKCLQLEGIFATD
jgi:hypothetical protein